MHFASLLLYKINMFHNLAIHLSILHSCAVIVCAKWIAMAMIWIIVILCAIEKWEKLKQCVRLLLSKDTETRELSWYQLRYHWWRRWLLWWQPLMPPVTIKLASWQLSVFIVILSVEIHICVRCDMSFIDPMHRNEPNITYQYSFFF